MEDLLLDYGLFLAKTVTWVVAVAVVVLLIVLAVSSVSRRGKDTGALKTVRLNERLDELADGIRTSVWPKARLKEQEKQRKKERKAREKAQQEQPRAHVYVLDFKGDMRASAVASLREEISAIVAMAEPDDEVLLRLENPGGVVFDHGLAASQLLRLKERGLTLTVVVDKVAASGGYMMACVADRIVAAPFAVLGSIGVLAQLPNFHRMLKEHGVDFELFKGGRFKRTVTMFGDNTDADRAKFQEEIDEIHTLFREFVAEQRPSLDIEAVGTGEHWFGRDALKLGLCDELGTSDDWLMRRREDSDLLQISYRRRRSLPERLGQSILDAPAVAVERTLQRLWERRLDV
jgi:serine protease SohB